MEENKNTNGEILNSIDNKVTNIIKNIENKSQEEKTTELVIDNVNANKAIVEEKQQAKTDLQLFSEEWRIATQLAKSSIIPDNYKNKPENVVIALGMAQQLDLTPFTVMQNLNIIKGKTSWSGSFCKTLIEKTRRFKDLELNYIGQKGTDSYGCYLSATRISDGKIINGPEVTMKMAKEEGWTTNKKWLTLTDLMLAYRCQSFFARLHCPEAMSGVYTTEEIEDINKERRIVDDVL
jgi:hypothetical protein